MYLYIEAGLNIPLEIYLLTGLATIIVTIYTYLFIGEFKQLRSINKEYFQYLEMFMERFG